MASTSTNASSSAAEPGFEFPRELERQLHDGVLREARASQRVSFRPGVTAAGRAVDVVRQERTAKKIAKTLKTLQDEYAFAADDERKQQMAHEALQYTNKLEDALQFLALQFTSDELPATLRAMPGGEVAPARSGDGEDGELAVAVNAKPAPVYEEREADDDDDEAVETVAEVAESWDDLEDADKQDSGEQPPPVEAASAELDEAAADSRAEESKTALSWTQQYLQVIAQREEEEARQAAEFAKLSPGERYLIELENQFRGMLTIVQQAKSDKAPKKKQKNLAMELQLLRQRLTERGWSEQEFYAREKGESDETNDADDGSSKQKSKRKKKSKKRSESDATDAEEGAEPAPVAAEKSSADAAADLDDDESYGGNLFGGGDDDDDDESSSTVAASGTVTTPTTGEAAESVDPSAEDDAEAAPPASGKSKGGRGSKAKKKAANASDSTTAASWTGKSPRDHIQDYCKKYKLPKPVYKKLAGKGRTHLYSLVLDFKSHKKEFAVPVDDFGGQLGFATIDEAKDTVTTHALYDLMPALPLYRVLPPLYRDMWLEWVRAKEKDAADAVSQEKAGFDAVVSGIFDNIPDEVRAKISAVTDVETEAQKQPDTGATKKPDTEVTAENVLEDWSMDDWDADLSDAEKSEQPGDWEDGCGATARAQDGDAVSALNDADGEEEDPALQAYSQKLKAQLQGNMRSKAFKELHKRRQDLPITSFKTNVLQALESHNVILISGETGCGKSTQVPQFLLEDALLAKEQGASCQIVCTQPRRLAAISLAERVSQELGEASMGSGDSLCGFQIRLENRMTKHTRLLFCTTGILLRKLQEVKTLESELSHIIVDEVHERDLQNDVLLSMLRQFLAGPNLKRKKPLKVILMSATLNAASFQKYFGGESVCPMLSVPGRTFPVREFYLEDVLEMTEYVIDDTSPAYIPYESVQNSTQIKVSGRGGTSFSQKVFWEASDTSAAKPRRAGGDAGEESEYSERTLKSLDCIDSSVINYELIQELIEHLVKETDLVQLSDSQLSASILVFLPGLNEISTLLDMLGGHRIFRDERKFSLLPLHSSLSPQDQQRIFQMPRGIVRIIATTNIAETSLTVEDVKVVIDSGRVKEMRHNSTQRTNVLDEIWISRANAKQRMGRAGRTSGGTCYRLFPKYIYRSTMDEQPIPEIKRAPLTSLCLQIKTFGVDVSCSEFLGSCLDPPEEASVRDALNELFEIGALDRGDETEKLTTLGVNLAKLPVDVKVGKMLLLAALFDVFDPISTCAAIMETKSPFVAPYGHQSEMQAARKRFAVAQSDLLTDVNAYEAWRVQFLRPRGSSNNKAEREFCREHFLSHRSLMEITKLKQQFYGLVAQAGYLPKQQQQHGVHALLTREQVAMATSILYAGLAPNLVHIERSSSSSDSKKRFLLRDQDHTLVVVHPSSINHKNVSLASSFLTYSVKLHTSQIYLPASSIVLPVAVCLFSHSLEILSQARGGGIGLRINEWVMFQSSFRSAVLLQELRSVVTGFIATSLENPPFLMPTGSSKQSSADHSNRVEDDSQAAILKKTLRALVESEYDQHDPKQALTAQLSLSKDKR